MKRVFLWLLLAIGIGLIVVPIATGMFDKTSKGETMVNTFRPIMQPASVDKTVTPARGIAIQVAATPTFIR